MSRADDGNDGTNVERNARATGQLPAMTMQTLGLTRSRLLALAASTALAAGARTGASASDVGAATFGWGPGPEGPQILQAIDKKLWDRHGLTVKTVTFNSGSAAMEALLGGQLDFAAMAELPPAIAALQSQKLKVIAVYSRYRGNRVIANFPLRSMSDLAGRKIGVILGTTTELQADTALKNAHVQAALLSLAPPDIISSLARGDIDAAFTFPAAYAIAQKVLGEKYHELRISTPSTFVLVATDDVIVNHPDRVRSFLAGVRDGNATFGRDRAGSAALVSASTGGSLSVPAVEALWADYQFSAGIDSELPVDILKDAQWIHQRGLVKGPAPTTAMLSPFILLKV
jgi:ABC-type nitrate/sulfonate/bicarbonate transport system substrate-binding protein